MNFVTRLCLNIPSDMYHHPSQHANHHVKFSIDSNAHVQHQLFLINLQLKKPTNLPGELEPVNHVQDQDAKFCYSL